MLPPMIHSQSRGPLRARGSLYPYLGVLRSPTQTQNEHQRHERNGCVKSLFRPRRLWGDVVKRIYTEKVGISNPPKVGISNPPTWGVTYCWSQSPHGFPRRLLRSLVRPWLPSPPLEAGSLNNGPALLLAQPVPCLSAPPPVLPPWLSLSSASRAS